MHIRWSLSGNILRAFRWRDWLCRVRARVLLKHSLLEGASLCSSGGLTCRQHGEGEQTSGDLDFHCSVSVWRLNFGFIAYGLYNYYISPLERKYVFCWRIPRLTFAKIPDLLPKTA